MAVGGAVYENPLVPHAVLRRMYDGMKTLRAIEPQAAAAKAGARGLRGEEAARVASLLSLAAGDLVSDVPGSVVEARRKASGRAGARETLAPETLLLPPAEDAAERLMLAMGAAAALRSQGAGRLVLAYAEADVLPGAKWRQVLGVAGQAELPIVFLLLPGAGDAKQGVVSDRAQGWGVPGMPVDAADAVALYRVMQESALRARGGDGPALIECVRWRVAGGAAGETEDGVAAMRQVLRRRGLLTRR